MWGGRSGGERRFAPRSDTARAHMAQTTLTHDTAPSEGPTGGGANAPPVADRSVARLLIHTRAAASSHICGGDAGVPRLQHTSLTCEVEQAVPLRIRNPSPPFWRRGRGASLYQCSAAGGAHPGRRSPAQCRTKPRCPSLLCRPRRVTSPGKVASHRRARGFGRAAARGGHCELTPPGARGRREMSTFGDTSSQVQRRGETLRVNTSRHTGTARDEHLR